MGVWSFEVGLQLSKEKSRLWKCLLPSPPPKKKKRETLFIQKKRGGDAEERLLKQWHNCVTW